MTNDIVTTTGRQMSKNLQHALDNMTGTDRKVFILAAEEHEDGKYAALYRALALELRLCDLRDAALLQSLSAVDDVIAWEPPATLPPRNGLHLLCDPETGRVDTFPEAC